MKSWGHSTANFQWLTKASDVTGAAPLGDILKGRPQQIRNGLRIRIPLGFKVLYSETIFCRQEP